MLYTLRAVAIIMTAWLIIAATVAAQPFTLRHTFDDPTPTDMDRFGRVEFDGNRVLIGAHGDDTSGTDVGQAHLFDATTGNLLFTFDDPTPTVADSFGRSVALDGNRVLIGATL